MNTVADGTIDTLLLDQSGELLLLVDPASLRIHAANRHAHERLGYPSGGLVGMAVTDIVAALSDVFYWEATQAGDCQPVDAVEGLFRGAGGELFPVEESVRRIEAGEAVWLALRARDITPEMAERELLARTGSQLRATLEATADGILVRDRDGGIVNMNRRFAAIWGLPEELLARAVDADVFEYMASRFERPEEFRARWRAIGGLLEEETVDVLDLSDGQVLEQKTRAHYLEERIVGRVYTYTDITERKRAERLLLRREQEFRSVVESSPDNIIRYDRDGRAVYVNQMMSRSVDLDTGSLIGKRPIECADPFVEKNALARYQHVLLNTIRTGVPGDIELDTRTPDGIVRTHHIRFVAERNAEGRIIGALAFGRDITDRRLADAERRIAAIAFESQEAIAITDADQVILRVNNAFTRITGYAPEEAVGRTPSQLLKSGRHPDSFYREMWDALNHEGHWQGEIWNLRKDGSIFPEWLTITVVKDECGRLVNYVAAFSDTSRSKQAEAEIHTLAFYDPLTELPNRRLLMDRLAQTLASSERSRRYGALLLIDLDHFKELNDTKGHGVGDLLLIEIARRLRRCLRADDTVARLGGDEFVVILADIDADSAQAAIEAEAIAEKIRGEVNRPAELQGHEYVGSPSIGICLFSGNGVTVAELLKRADTAMYQAKRSGRNAIRFFDPDTHAAMEARIALDGELRRALPDSQFRLHFQVQVDHDRDPVGAEALLRWQHPVRGLVAPQHFIPLAEETGLIVAAGRWVLESACGLLTDWAADPAMRQMALAVNVSARQFRQADFVGQVLDVLARTGAQPSRLKLELTESLVLDNVDDTIAKMAMLREVGVRFSLDDFGTGYSSLAYLSRLPLDQVKIDKSFVGNIGVARRDQVIVQTIIGMAANLGLEVIAEGVETVAQLDFLRDNGCPLYQGYLFGRPMPLDEFWAAFHAAG